VTSREILTGSFEQASRVLSHLKFVPHYLLPQKKGETAGTRIQAEETDEILGYNKNFKQFVRKTNTLVDS